MIKSDKLPTNLEQLAGMIEYTTAAGERIGGAFVWEKTTQGHNYWDAVVRNLSKITRQLETHSKLLKGETPDGNE